MSKVALLTAAIPSCKWRYLSVGGWPTQAVLWLEWGFATLQRGLENLPGHGVVNQRRRW